MYKVMFTCACQGFLDNEFKYKHETELQKQNGENKCCDPWMYEWVNGPFCFYMNKILLLN